MWFEYWESKGIPAPLFEINDLVVFVNHADSEIIPLKVEGISLVKGKWFYHLSLDKRFKGLSVPEKELSKYVS